MNQNGVGYVLCVDVLPVFHRCFVAEDVRSVKGVSGRRQPGRLHLLDLWDLQEFQLRQVKCVIEL